jgi:predicted dehydrogenase
VENIRLGIIGCGAMGKTHIRSALEAGKEINVTAVCDIVTEKVREAAKMLGIKTAVTNYKEMVGDVDAVIIALPHDIHFEVGLYFINAGKHVLMEKPLCNTEDECTQLIKRANEKRKILMVAYPVRHWPIILKMKEFVETKTYGDVFQMSIWTEQYTKRKEGHWLHSRSLHGGQFFDHGCHYVDLLLWFLGKPTSGVHMGTNLGTPWMEKEGTSNVIIKFESGAMGYHFGTWGARGTKLGYSFHIHCTNGLLEYNRRADSDKLFLYTNKRGKEMLMEDFNTKLKGVKSEIFHFLECIKTGKIPLTDGCVGLQSLRIIWTLYEAEKNNKVANLKELCLY